VFDPNSYWGRRMQRRRFLGVTITGATAAAIAAACGGGDDEQTSTTTDATSAAGATQATQAPAAAKAVKGGTLNIAMARDATTFDPARNQDVYGGMVISLVGESLYEIDKEGNTAGRIVQKTENPEPNVYVWSLRPGVKFQDGTDVNAEAVKFNIQRHIDDPKSVRNQDVKDVTSIETPDANTVRATLKGPFAPFPNKLSGAAGTLYSPAAVQKLGENLQRDLTGAGAGAYKLTEWSRDTSITLDRNDTYWKKDGDGVQLPYMDKIVLKIFPDENVRLTNVKTGDADALNGNPPPKDVEDLKKDSSLTFKEIPGLGWSFITLNTEKEPFNNPAARRALSYAIDREQILKTVNFNVGKVQDWAIPDTISWAYDTSESAHPYSKPNVAKAKEELAKAGVPNGFKFTFQISNASPVLQQTAELIKDQIKAIGLDMEIQLIEFATVVSNANAGDYQSSGIGWSGGTDPDDNLYSLFYTKAGFNLSKYSNPQLDALLDQGRTTLDRNKRGEIYKQAQKILIEDLPFIVYQQNVQISLVRKNIQSYPQTYNGYWGARDFDQIWRSR